jgi:hypothetical protein
VSVAEIRLTLIWDLVDPRANGVRDVVYILDAQGRLIAHPNSGLMLRNGDFSSLAQVRAARATGSGAQVAQDINSREVLTAYAAVAPLGWLVFVELPAEEANAPAQ